MQGNVGVQAIGVVVVLLYSGLMSWLLLWFTRWLVGMRVDANTEQIGLDISLRREQLGN